MFTILCGIMMSILWKKENDGLLAPIIVILTVSVMLFAGFADIGLLVVLLLT